MAAEMLDRFQMVAKKDLFPEQLVGVARALIGEPKLLLADEPTVNLYSDQTEEIMKLFQKLNKEEMTIILVTHSNDKACYGNRKINLVDGTLIQITDIKKLGQL